jgi:hypothetical protein
MSRYIPKFNHIEADKAHKEWGFSCGPASVAAICGLTLEELRPHLGDFEQKRFTNPTLMYSILNSLGKPWSDRKPLDWPTWGIVRIQWHGPWMADGVPIKARYRHTHWVGAARVSARIDARIGVWDVNVQDEGYTGWSTLEDWKIIVPPAVAKYTPRADGTWSITHSIEVQP